MTKLKENAIAFVGALLLTGVVIVLINHSWSNFATDVLWAQKPVVQTDLSAYQSGNTLVVVSNKEIPNVASMTFELAFNPEKVQIQEDQIVSPADIAIQKINPGNYYIMLTNLKAIKKGEKLLEIKNVSKEAIVNINFGHIQVIDNNWNVLNLTLSK